MNLIFGFNFMMIKIYSIANPKKQQFLSNHATKHKFGFLFEHPLMQVKVNQ